MGRGRDRDALQPVEPDFVTGAFSVGVTSKRAPASISDRLADLEVTRRPGTCAMLITSDGVVSMYLSDLLEVK